MLFSHLNNFRCDISKEFESNCRRVGILGRNDHLFVKLCHVKDIPSGKQGGDETRWGNVRYVQGVQPNVPARTMFIDIYIVGCRGASQLGGSPLGIPLRV